MFFQVDDQFHVNKKAKELARKALANDIRGLAAIGLWTVAGSMCQGALSDGVSEIEDLVSITLNHAIAIELADLLVSAGLWHAPGHECERCPAVRPGTYLYHDWYSMGYDRGHQVKVKREKAKELKNRELIARVWARDCIDPAKPNIGRCRYCATELHKKDTRSPDGPQMDHVDPTKAAGVENVALACGPCNRKKAQRTPEAADMKLLPAPSHSFPAANVTVSPAPADAGMPSSPAQGTTSAKTSVETSAEPAPEPQRESLLACAGDRAGAGRAGQGRVPEGLRDGLGGDTRPEPSTRSSRKRRGKGRTRTRSQGPDTRPQQKPNNNAGQAPEVEVAGRFGSPWHGWSGKPSTVEETTCYDHNEEQPCWKCAEEPR